VENPESHKVTVKLAGGKPTHCIDGRMTFVVCSRMTK
jgi:hypothetical protein